MNIAKNLLFPCLLKKLSTIFKKNKISENISAYNTKGIVSKFAFKYIN